MIRRMGVGMKAEYRVNGSIVFTVEATHLTEVFQQMAELDGIFHDAETCGRCQNDRIGFQVRHPQGHDYYELVCRNPECRARFSLGQLKDTTATVDLYPKRKDADGNWKQNRGWEKYDPNSSSTGPMPAETGQDGGSAPAPPAPSYPPPAEQLHPRLRALYAQCRPNSNAPLDREMTVNTMKKLAVELRELKGEGYAKSVWDGVRGKNLADSVMYLFNAVQMAEQSASQSTQPDGITDDDVPF